MLFLFKAAASLALLQSILKGPLSSYSISYRLLFSFSSFSLLRKGA
ncbi:hypothetical protein HAT2_00374 [Candidatus Similichlamydia laticola]|uniref:Uncharacterized protein n=1 Tax=Candidatus Similichlamydia laticola TaxID=2170265 RepID=A0A369KDG5_9BACT|nr:hypothetical protein HAT2_00374 [Candidatus Similichlamydia laticola]